MSETSKPLVPTIDGWFTDTDTPHLLGSQCVECKTYFFPKESVYCRSPLCQSSEFEEVELTNWFTVGILKTLPGSSDRRVKIVCECQMLNL